MAEHQKGIMNTPDATFPTLRVRGGRLSAAMLLRVSGSLSGDGFGNLPAARPEGQKRFDQQVDGYVGVALFHLGDPRLTRFDQPGELLLAQMAREPLSLQVLAGELLELLVTELLVTATVFGYDQCAIRAGGTVCMAHPTGCRRNASCPQAAVRRPLRFSRPSGSGGSGGRR